jgi:hypothetical protein
MLGLGSMIVQVTWKLKWTIFDIFDSFFWGLISM